MPTTDTTNTAAELAIYAQQLAAHADPTALAELLLIATDQAPELDADGKISQDALALAMRLHEAETNQAAYKIGDLVQPRGSATTGSITAGYLNEHGAWEYDVKLRTGRGIRRETYNENELRAA